MVGKGPIGELMKQLTCQYKIGQGSCKWSFKIATSSLLGASGADNAIMQWNALRTKERWW